MRKRIIDGVLRNSNLGRVIEEWGIYKGNDKRVIREMGREIEKSVLRKLKKVY